MTRMLIGLMMAAVLASGAAFAQRNSGQDDPLTIPEYTKDEVICFALYTVSEGVLKLTAQLYPLEADDPRTVRLEIKENGAWKQIAETKVIDAGWTAPFRVASWDETKQVAYRVAHGEGAFFEGIIRKNPVDKDEIVVAAFTGNSVLSQHGGNIPKDDIVENLLKEKPDLLFFSGDQVYDHKRHLEAWLKFGRDFGQLIAQFPTITIPDDHDVGQANIWGAGGKKAKTQAGPGGGYFMPVDYVEEVHRAQTSHLPDPYDPRPIDRGISVYFTNLKWGGIGFAIIEDRKFKSGPEGLVPKAGPRPDHINDPNYDPKTVDVPGAVLLGERQLAFLDDWGTDWKDEEMKVVLSQTIFAGGAHIHGNADNRLHADMDSNGWPQTGRNKAIAAIRRSYSLMLAGDQHLATIFHHGIDDFGDSGFSFCVPSIANLYLRWWSPLEPGKNRLPGAPDYTGELLDGFDNKLTVYAVANPTPEENKDKLTTRAAGFGIVRFNKRDRTITMECWPRNTDITGPDTEQYPGWPLTIHQEDNYGRKAFGYLPTLDIIGQEDAVVQVVHEAGGEIVYTLRINGNTFTPKVFEAGSYTVYVGEGAGRKKLEHLGVQPDGTPGTVQVAL